MIRSFADAETERLFTMGTSRRLPADILRRAAQRLWQLDAATTLGDLMQPRSNRLEALKRDRAGQHSIRINDQWRIVFKWTAAGPEEVEIVDYH